MREIAVLTTVFLITGAILSYASDSGKFELQVTSNHLTLVAGDMTVRTVPDSLRFNLRGSYGTFSGDMAGGSRIHLADINVVRDNDHTKHVVLTSRDTIFWDGAWRFSLTLAMERNQPGVLIQFTKKNIGDIQARQYYFFRLIPINFPFYYDTDGEQCAERGVIPTTPWMFWPTANTVGGYGIIFCEPDMARLTTLFPREDWRRNGWYFSPGGDRHAFLAPGETHTISFRLMPALAPEEVADHYSRIKTEDTE